MTGIEKLAKLEEILLANCKKLISLEPLNGLQYLQSLEFDGTNKQIDFTNLKDLPNLEKLYLIDCGKVSSIKFIQNFPKLVEFGLLGNTEVADGNLLPATKIKNVMHRHRKYYNVKIVNQEYLDFSKRNIEKIKKIK